MAINPALILTRQPSLSGWEGTPPQSPRMPRYMNTSNNLDKQIAASTILRVFRQSRAGLTLLRTYDKELADLQHSQFQDLWKSTLMPLLRKGARNPVRHEIVSKAMADFILMRNDVHARKIIPLCRSINGKGDLPEFRMIAKSQLPRKPVFLGNCLLTRKCQQQFKEIKKAPLRKKEELDSLVKRLIKQTDLFPWDYTEDGCYSRARLMRDFLRLSGIPATHIRMQYVCIPKKDRAAGVANNWCYHVAPTVKLADGSWWIVDPALVQDQAVSAKAWIELQNRLPSLKNPVSVWDMGLLELNNSGKRKLSYQADECFTFTTRADVHMDIFLSSGTIKLSELDSDDWEAGIQLAAYRLLLEKSRLYTLPTPLRPERTP